MIKVKVNGIEGNFILDTLGSGAGFNVFRFNSNYMKSLGVDSSGVKTYGKKSSIDSNKVNNFYLTRLKEISLFNAPSINVRYVKASFLKGLMFDGIASINWLGQQITIIYGLKNIEV